MQLGHYTVCTTISLYLNERANNFGNMKIEVPKGSWRSNQTHVGTLCGYLWKSSRNKSQNEIPCTEESISARSTRILQTVFWSTSFRVLILLRQRGFLILLTQGRSSREVMRQEDGCSGSSQKKHFNFLKAKARWELSGFQDEQK